MELLGEALDQDFLAKEVKGVTEDIKVSQISTDIYPDDVLGAHKSNISYLGTIPVATCFECRGIYSKRKTPLNIGYILCPHCQHALYWERIQKGTENGIRET